MKMSETLNEVCKRVGEENLTNSCSGHKCTVDMTDVPSERVVIDVDLAFEAHGKTDKHCDRILLYTRTNDSILVIVLIEHKGNTFNSATDVARQLQGGVNLLKDFIPTGIKTTCVPVLFHGDGNHPIQFKKLRREQIRLGGKKFPIDKDKCNIPNNLANVLRRAKVLS